MICSNIKTDITPTIFSRDFVAQLYCATKLHIKTDITPTIFSRDFVAQLYCATKLQYATVYDVAQCNFGQTFGLETSVALRH